ncbi:MAG: DUF547 domain-containing protein [Pseudomonadota bacterium]
MKPFYLTFILSMWLFTAPLSSADTLTKPAQDYWSWHNPAEKTAPKHGALTNLLEAFWIKQEGLAFRAIKYHGIDYLNQYLTYLQRIPVTRLNRDEQLAYWLNLHNAGVIHLLSTRHTPRSISKYRGVPGSPGNWWREKILIVEGHPLSLEEISQDILLRHWPNPRVIYGIYNSAKGGPELDTQAFVGKTVYAQLDEAARRFINRSKHVRVDNRGQITLSSLYIWHKSMFNDDAAIIRHIKTYAEPSLANQLTTEAKIEDHTFNWVIAKFDSRRTGFDNRFTGRTLPFTDF